jgi:YD repeat-containing protein
MIVSLTVCTSHAVLNSVSYQYDALGRLTNERRSNGSTIAYTYDVNGNRTARIVSTTPDTIAPTIALSAPTTSTGSSVNPLFSALDDVQVTGYLLNESATPPTANYTGWSSAAPTSYTFTGITPGTPTSKTLYAWAKDAAGNMTSKDATITITIPVLKVDFINLNKGGGQINSNIGGMNCTGNPCITPFDFSVPAQVTLTGAADTDSFFTGWGMLCNGTGTCVLTMDSSKTVSTTFDRLKLVMIPGVTNSYYGLIANAYKAAVDKDTIDATIGIFGGDVILNKAISVTIKGGFDSAYSSNTTGYSTIYGKLIINKGKLNVERIIVK